MAETKRCPYCGEEILATAKKCRYCGEWLVEKQPGKKKQVPCEVCGEMIDEDAHVCPYCHEPVKRNVPQPVQSEAVASSAEVSTKRTKNTINAVKKCIYRIIITWLAWFILGVIAGAINDDEKTYIPVFIGFLTAIIYTCMFIYRAVEKPVYLGKEIDEENKPLIVWPSAIAWGVYAVAIYIVVFLHLIEDADSVLLYIYSTIGSVIAMYFSLGLYYNKIRDIGFKDDDSWFKQILSLIVGLIILVVVLYIIFF